MSFPSNSNAQRVDTFSEHMLHLFTLELSRRTESAYPERQLDPGPTSSLLDHQCEEICSPIIHDLVSAFLNPGRSHLLHLTIADVP